MQKKKEQKKKKKKGSVDDGVSPTKEGEESGVEHNPAVRKATKARRRWHTGREV